MRRANQIVPTMMMAVMAAAFVAVAATANGAELKFHPAPGIAPVVGRYLVTLDPSVTADFAHSSAEELARAYVGQLEPNASSDVRQFAIAMLPSRARSLSADSRVLDIVEFPHPDDALAPPPSPSSVTAGLARQHLVPITRDSSSSGTYLYDGSGNIRSIGTDSYVYDSVGRLTQATVQGNQQSFTYDPFGNRTATVTANGAIGCVGGCDVPDTAVASPNHNHLSGATYDDAGSVTSEYGAAYTYDGTGMVRRATVGTDIRDFVYTADDERIAVRQGASWTWTVRDQGGKVLREFTSLETSPSPLTLTNHYWSKDYVWRSGLLLASVFPVTPASMSPTTTYHYHLDHLGTPRLVTDGNHILVGKHTYYPFGAEMNLTPTESAVELMKFTGHERDIVAATNGSVDYMHARYYNGNLGRFLSVDPGADSALPDLPQTWNRYTYGLSSPLRFADPTGLKPCKIKLNGGDAKTAGVADGTEVDGECVEATDPKITPVKLGWEWLTGTGPRDRHFTDGDDMTEMLKQHAHVQKVAQEVCGGSLDPQGSAPYRLSGVAGVPKYLRDYSTLATGGLTGNLTVTFLGSYGLKYSMSNGAVSMTVSNRSNVASGFRPPVLGYTAAWGKYVGDPLSRQFASGPMSETSQTFSFSVPCH